MRSPCIPRLQGWRSSNPNPAGMGLSRDRRKARDSLGFPGTRGWQSKVQVPGAAERGRGLPPPGSLGKAGGITTEQKLGGFCPKTGHKVRSGCFWGKTHLQWAREAPTL